MGMNVILTCNANITGATVCGFLMRALASGLLYNVIEIQHQRYNIYETMKRQ